MVSKYLKTKNQAGFSLMELLVTVSIIGVLSTAGVPVYRRMVAKAKSSEAKVNLGAMANVESMFQSEYSTYGNNLNMMGYNYDGSPANAIYAAGFFDAGCANVTVFPAGNLNVRTSIPDYELGAKAQTAFGRAKGANSRDAAGLATGAPGTKTSCPATEPVIATAFELKAAGVIRNGEDVDNSEINDIWTMDQDRNLKHTIDGT